MLQHFLAISHFSIIIPFVDICNEDPQNKIWKSLIPASSTLVFLINNINSQLGATITTFIDNYNQLNMFRAIISPILRSTRLFLQLVV